MPLGYNGIFVLDVGSMDWHGEGREFHMKVLFWFSILFLVQRKLQRGEKLCVEWSASFEVKIPWNLWNGYYELNYELRDVNQNGINSWEF